MQTIMQSLSTGIDTDIRYKAAGMKRLLDIHAKIDECQSMIRRLEQDQTVIQKEIKIQETADQKNAVEQEINDVSRQVGRIEEAIQKLEEALAHATAEEKRLKKETEALHCEDVSGHWQKEYERLRGTRSAAQFCENYARQQKANETRRNDAESRMIEDMWKYKSKYDFGAAPTMKGYPEFEAAFEKLRNSDLLTYEEKVRKARESAEEEFRTQFLARMQENIKQSQAEFKRINRALNGIDFNGERYEFICRPSRSYRAYYDMIMDDFNVMRGESIFSGTFNEMYRDVIAELFRRLSCGQDTEQALSEFTDYRTYMDYDMKITHPDGDYSFYSKVCTKMSGGQTQTPFYVVIAASFVQVYSNNLGGEAAGIVLFDEAFNNMDDERIKGILEFLVKLPLQIVAAAPPEKIPIISPYVKKTLLVMVDESGSYVEEFDNAIL